MKNNELDMASDTNGRESRCIQGSFELVGEIEVTLKT
jgi:hypothetical protein